MTTKQKIKQLTNTLDLCGLDYPKREWLSELNDKEYLFNLGVVFSLNGLNMNDYIVEVV